MLKLLNIIILLLLTLNTYPSLYAAPYSQTQSTGEAEVTSYAFDVTNEIEHNAAIQFISEQIKSEKALNPNIEAQIKYVKDSSTSDLASNKLYRASFTLLRGLVNGGGAFIGLMIKGQNTVQSLEFGAVVGVLCGSLQFLNEPVQKFITTNFISKIFKVKNFATQKLLNRAEEISKLFTIEVVFLGVLKIVGIKLGLDSNTENIISSVLITTFKSFFGQAVFEIGNARLTQTAKLNDPAKAKAHQIKGDLRTLVFSCLMTISQVTELVLREKLQLPFAVLTAAGLGFYITSLLQKKNTNNNCESLLSTKE